MFLLCVEVCAARFVHSVICHEEHHSGYTQLNPRYCDGRSITYGKIFIISGLSHSDTIMIFTSMYESEIYSR